MKPITIHPGLLTAVLASLLSLATMPAGGATVVEPAATVDQQAEPAKPVEPAKPAPAAEKPAAPVQPAAAPASAPEQTVVQTAATTNPVPNPVEIKPVFDKNSNLDISFFIVEHVDARGNSHRFAADKVESSPDATVQGFSMLISTILPEREIGEITGMFKIGDELWSFATRSIALINSGRLIVNTKVSVKDKETGSTELISKEPYNTVKVIGNREQNITEFIDVGVKIEAKPVVLEDGRVHAKMKMSISEVLRENDNTRLTRVPVVSFRTVNTSVDFEPGKLELLSELTIRKTTEMNSGIPYLRKIPFLGKLLFAHTSKQDVDTKLYIVGGVSAPQEQQIAEYEALKKQIEEERLAKLNPYR